VQHLASHAFPGIPPHLQILHIEQEVAGTELSVLQTVLATDIEREALLEEARILQSLIDAEDSEHSNSSTANTNSDATSNGITNGANNDASHGTQSAESNNGSGVGEEQEDKEAARKRALYESFKSMSFSERSEHLTDIYNRLQSIDADAAPARASTILAGLGFTLDMQNKPTKASCSFPTTCYLSYFMHYRFILFIQY
jgi:ATP-binding cassette subfamily F protein 3